MCDPNLNIDEMYQQLIEEDSKRYQWLARKRGLLLRDSYHGYVLMGGNMKYESYQTLSETIDKAMEVDNELLKHKKG